MKEISFKALALLNNSPHSFWIFNWHSSLSNIHQASFFVFDLQARRPSLFSESPALMYSLALSFICFYTVLKTILIFRRGCTGTFCFHGNAFNDSDKILSNLQWE